jgi:hypothetical protein
MNPVTIGKATLYNADCMELMAQYPDKYFEPAPIANMSQESLI